MANYFSQFEDEAVPQQPPQQSSNFFAPFEGQELKNMPPQMAGTDRALAIPATGVAKGVLQTIGLPGDVSNIVDNYLSNWLGKPDPTWFNKLTGIPPSDPKYNLSGAPIATSAETLDMGRKLGAVDRPDLNPVAMSPIEKIENAAAEGTGKALPFAAIPGFPLAGTVIGGAAGGAADQAGKEFFPNSPSVQKALTLAGALTGGGIGNAGARAVSAATDEAPEVMAAFNRLGVTPRLAGDVSGSRFLQGAQALAAKSPGGENRIGGAAEQQAADFSNALENTAAKLGSSSTPQEAGTVGQAEAQKWLQNFRQNQQQAENNLLQYIPNPQAREVPVGNYAAALDTISKTFPDAPATGQALQSGLNQKLLGALQSDVGTGSLQDAKLSWQSARNARTRIGELLSDPNLPADATTSELKRLYGALTDDMRGHMSDIDAQTVAQGGQPGALAAFDNAADVTRNGHRFVESVISPILKQGTSPAQAANTILQSGRLGDTNLAAIRQEMPDFADELAALKLRQAGMSPDSVRSENPYSPGSFHTNIGPLHLSPEARNTLFADPDIAQSVKDLET